MSVRAVRAHGAERQPAAPMRGGAVSRRAHGAEPQPVAPTRRSRSPPRSRTPDAGYGTTVTGHRPAFTRRTATEPTIRCPACSEAPTTTASALRSSAACTRPV